MKSNIESLNTTKLQKQLISRSIGLYSTAGIDISFKADKANVRVSIIQDRLINGYILSGKQLHERAKEVFNNLRAKYKIDVIFQTYTPEIDDITQVWIEKKMKEFALSRNDILKQMFLDKSSLSLILSGERGLTKSMKAAFFYYFLTYEINRDLRENIFQTSQTNRIDVTSNSTKIENQKAPTPKKGKKLIGSKDGPTTIKSMTRKKLFYFRKKEKQKSQWHNRKFIKMFMAITEKFYPNLNQQFKQVLTKLVTLI